MIFFSPITLVSAISRQFPEALFFKPTTQPVIALTIDDVGDASTQQLVDVIADHNQKMAGIEPPANATFFIMTHHLNDNPGILETLFIQNHEIGNHGIYDHTHANLKPEELEQELYQAHEALTRKSQTPVKWFRPGRGRYNQGMVKILSQMVKSAGYYPQFALASMIPLDTYQFTNHPQFTTQYVSQFIFPGSILVLHGGSESRTRQTKIALKQILSYCSQNHYQVVSLTDLYEQF
jgi:peptidoglycan/xylan/chitin deacetylase (PgdA/CDA1 family)